MILKIFMDIVQIPILKDNYVFLVHDPLSGQTAVVDPAEAAPVMDCLSEQGWTLTHILNTHFHGDHVGGNLTLKSLGSVCVYGKDTPSERIPGLDRAVDDGASIPFGNVFIQVLWVPGHTQGHLAFWFEREQWLFCGDTLFAMGCGRLLAGTAEQLWASLERIRALPPKTLVFCAHEYTLNNGLFAQTVEPNNVLLKRRVSRSQHQRSMGIATVPFLLEEELDTNPFLRVYSPEIRHHLNLTNQSDLEVFRVLRERKDHF